MKIDFKDLKKQYEDLFQKRRLITEKIRYYNINPDPHQKRIQLQQQLASIDLALLEYYDKKTKIRQEHANTTDEKRELNRVKNLKERFQSRNITNIQQCLPGLWEKILENKEYHISKLQRDLLAKCAGCGNRKNLTIVFKDRKNYRFGDLYCQAHVRLRRL